MFNVVAVACCLHGMQPSAKTGYPQRYYIDANLKSFYCYRQDMH